MILPIFVSGYSPKRSALFFLLYYTVGELGSATETNQRACIRALRYEHHLVLIGKWANDCGGGLLRRCLGIPRSALAPFKINCRYLGCGLGGFLILQECLLEYGLQGGGRPGRLNAVLIFKLSRLNGLRLHPRDLRG